MGGSDPDLASGIDRLLRLDDQNRLIARRGTAGRHELAAVGDRFDVEQDRPRLGIAGQIVDDVPEIDVELVAQRKEVRKADPSAPSWRLLCT